MQTPPLDSPDERLQAWSDTRRLTGLGVASLVLALVLFLLWAALAPLDEGVPAAGLVSVDTKRKPVQHLQGGIIKSVHVHEGELVEQGQVLLTLEPASTMAGLETVRQHYLALRATESRLLAELLERPSISWHPDLLAMKQDPMAEEHMGVQQRLLLTRRSVLAATISAMEESLAGQQALLQGAQRSLVNRRKQQYLLQQELDGIRDLVKDGYAPRNRELELDRQAAEIASAIVELESNAQRLTSGVAEVRQRIYLTKQESRKELETQLAEVRREVQADAEKLTAVRQDMDRTEIRSPVKGQVIGLNVQAAGAVITTGQKLMDIVPTGAALVIEARVPPQVIDRLRLGQHCDVRFSAFAHSPQLVVEGKVDSVSNDLLSDPDTRQPYYLVRVSLTDKGRKALGQRQLQPGMMTEVVIRTGERSLLTYLAYPLVRRLAQSMKEE